MAKMLKQATSETDVLNHIDAIRRWLAQRIVHCNDCGEDERVAEYAALDERLARCERALHHS